MARSIWKGSLSFGLVEIPVGLVSAESKDEISFSMLDKRDLGPVGYKRYNKKTGGEVPWSEIVKGYEYEPDQYVIVGDADLKRAAPAKSEAINIVAFVDAEEIAPWHFEGPYYLEPLKKDSKGYALLREALQRTKKVGIARFVLRSKEHLAALVSRGDVLVLNTLRYTHEIRDTAELTVPTTNLARLGVSAKELEMAEQLVHGLSEPWDPAQYTDTYRDDVLRMIEEKIRAGQTHVIEEVVAPEDGAPRRAEVVDLMPLLRQSLEAAGKDKGAIKRPARAAAAAAGEEHDAQDERPAPKAAAKKKTAKAASGGKTRRAAHRTA